MARGTEARLRQADADLARYELMVSGADVGSTLRRGFALVSEPANELLPTRTRAAAVSRMTLTFADGVLEAVPLHEGEDA